MTQKVQDSDYRVSRYNFCVYLKDKTILYNSLTGAMMTFNGKPDRLTNVLTGDPHRSVKGLFDKELEEHLLKGGYILSPEKDELLEIKERFWDARGKASMSVTITTTMDCNLGCYYCYESRSKEKLTIRDIDSVIDLICSLKKSGRKKSLLVQWYGGEPLMNLEFMEECSLAIQEFCKDNGIRYKSSVLSNGTCWPDDIEDFVNKHKITSVQIPLDGLEENHNKRRNYRKEYRSETGGNNSFKEAVNLIDKLVQHTEVHVRINLDPGNKNDWKGIVEMADSRGWFSAPYPVITYGALLEDLSDRSRFMNKRALDDVESERIKRQITELAMEKTDGKLKTLYNRLVSDVDNYPHPKKHVCSALSSNSISIGAEGATYSCLLQAGESNRSIGHIRNQNHNSDIIATDSTARAEQQDFWGNFDPTELENCRKCSFLPLCWGGCPKNHLENVKEQLNKLDMYWRSKLPKMIAKGAGETISDDYCFSESDQFR